jgi:double-strand break repair protein MRE11
VWEKEEDRRDDSFRAFEEILQLAKQQNVDMLLLGGDLFHDNKPSRTTINRTIQLMNKYCLGDTPVQIQVLNSNQAEIFVEG